MRTFLCAIFLVALLSVTMTTFAHVKKAQIKSSGSSYPAVRASKFCPECLTFMSGSLEVLIELAMSGAVFNSCGDLCTHVPAASQTVCNYVCDAVGIGVFLRLLKMVDPDPIYVCELLRQCPIKDCNLTNCADMVSTKVVPAIFDIDHQDTAVFTGVMNAYSDMGTSAYWLVIDMPGTAPDVSIINYVMGWKKGINAVNITVKWENVEDLADGPAPYYIKFCEGFCILDPSKPSHHDKVLGQVNGTITFKN